jgi:hypothetical protein
MAVRTKIKLRIRKKGFDSKKIKKKYNDALKKIIAKTAEKGKENIRSEIKKRDLIDTGTMYNSVTATPMKVVPGVKYTVDAEHAKYVNTGVRKHKMIYLTKSDAPIPINAANGLFRWASPKAMKEGKFVHPGFTRGKGFVQAAMKRTRKYAMDRLRTITRKIF